MSRPRTGGLGGVRAVLLDFYGTLAEARGFDVEARVRVLHDSLRGSGLDLDAEAFGAAYREVERRHRRRMAEEATEIHNTVWVADALAALGHGATAASPPVVAAVDAYLDRFVEELAPYPEAPEALERLASKWRLSLVSNFTDPRPVLSCLRRDRLDRWFEIVVVSAEVGRRKPHPEIFRVALDRMEMEAAEVLYVGDHPVADVQGARGVGMLTARVARPGAEPDAYPSWETPSSAEDADLVVEDLLQLADALEAAAS